MNNNSNRPTIRILPRQEMLRRELPKVTGNVDYTLFEEDLKTMDEVIVKSGIEALFVKWSLEIYVARARVRADGVEAGGKALERRQRQSRSALRCTVLRHMLGESYRDLSMRLASRDCGTAMVLRD